MDQEVYNRMAEMGYTGLEIAPTRILTEHPYEHPEEVSAWSASLKGRYGFMVSSMQSIWYGRTERIFGEPQETAFLEEYTYKAIRFAVAAGCGNLVFGCPKNRALSENGDPEGALAFFGKIGRYAQEKNCVIAMEANPPVYQTNFINTTQQAIGFVQRMDCPGLLLNLDVGTMVENEESVRILKGHEGKIHHVHISEPGLAPLQKRKIHEELADFLKNADYKGFISIEVKKTEDMDDLWRMMEYVKDIFG